MRQNTPLQRWYHGTLPAEVLKASAFQHGGRGQALADWGHIVPGNMPASEKNLALASTPAQVRRLLGQQCPTVIKLFKIRVRLLHSGLIEQRNTSSACAMLPCARSVHSLMPLSALSWPYHSLFHSVVVLCAWHCRSHSFDFLSISEPLAVEEKGSCSWERFGYRAQWLKICFLRSPPLPAFLSFPCLLVCVVGGFLSSHDISVLIPLKDKNRQPISWIYLSSAR